MQNKFSFFKLMWLEVKKIYRSPILFVFLLVGPFILLSLVGIVSNSFNIPTANYTMTQQQASGDVNDDNVTTISTNSIEFVGDFDNMEDGIKDVILTCFGDDINWQNNLDNALFDLKLANCLIVVNVDTSISPNKLTIYYTSSDTISISVKTNISNTQNEYSYLLLKNYLAEYGVTIDDSFFRAAEIQMLETPTDATMLKKLIPHSFGFIIAFVLILGISFSMARDNETNVIKQLCYTPMKSEKYLLIRGILYAILGVFQLIVLILTANLFGTYFAGTFWGILGIGVLFVCSFIALSMMLSTAKNQISAISLAVMFIIIPVLVVEFANIYSLNIGLQIILYLSPVTSFLCCIKSYVYYGVVKTLWLIIMAIEFVIYLLITTLITKHNLGKLKFLKPRQKTLKLKKQTKI